MLHARKHGREKLAFHVPRDGAHISIVNLMKEMVAHFSVKRLDRVSRATAQNATRQPDPKGKYFLYVNVSCRACLRRGAESDPAPERGSIINRDFRNRQYRRNTLRHARDVSVTFPYAASPRDIKNTQLRLPF